MADPVPTTNARSPYLIDVGNNKVVKLQLKASSMDAGLIGVLGIAPMAASGEVPVGKTLVGTGRLAAMQNGCFGINVVYAKTATKSQTAKVLCSPSKADTVFVEARGKTYNGKNIVDVRVPRRRVYTF
jgi:hypothetical protein